MDRSITVNQQALTELQLSKHRADIVIQPELFDIDYFDFHRAEEIISRGEEAARQVLERLK